MKALYSAPTADEPPKYTLNVVDRPKPSSPPPGYAIVKVLASGINPSDGGNAIANLFKSTKPIIPGRDFAGVIDESSSTSFPRGTPVFGSSGNVISFTVDGTAAEYVTVPEDALVRKPDQLSYAQAGAMGVPYASAMEILENSRIQKRSDTVLILGATGAVGRATASICRAWGNKVVTASRRDTTDVNVISDPTLSKVTTLLGGSGPNLIVDLVGSADLVDAALKILGKGGRYALLSAGKGGVWEAKFNMLSLYRLAQTIIGINSIDHTPKEVAEYLTAVADMVEHDGLEGPNEKELVKIKIEDSPESYAQAFKFTGEKHVICFE